MKFVDNFKKSCLDEGSMPSTSTNKEHFDFARERTPSRVVFRLLRER